ncbi:DUF6210 family protein [Spirillospora sp. NPDC127200]
MPERALRSTSPTSGTSPTRGRSRRWPRRPSRRAGTRRSSGTTSRTTAGSARSQTRGYLFEKRFRGAGRWGLPWPEAERERLREIVESVSCWSCDEKPYPPLRLDESRAAETDEAWVPVLTPDGPGTLVWPNSD